MKGNINQNPYLAQLDPRPREPRSCPHHRDPQTPQAQHQQKLQDQPPGASAPRQRKVMPLNDNIEGHF